MVVFNKWAQYIAARTFLYLCCLSLIGMKE